MITLESIILEQPQDVVDALLSKTLVVVYVPEGEKHTDLIDGYTVESVDYEGKPVVISVYDDNEELSYDQRIEFCNNHLLDVLPELFHNTLNSYQKDALRDFCQMPLKEKQKKLNSTSFCRFILTMLTGTDPVELPYIKDVNGVIKGLIFIFLDPERETFFQSEIADPMMQKEMSSEETTLTDTPEDETLKNICQEFVNFFKRNGVILSPEDDKELCIKNNIDRMLGNSKLYNILINLAALLPSEYGEPLENRILVVFDAMMKALDIQGHIEECPELDQYLLLIKDTVNKETEKTND